jgi:S-adenosylhomocysteine hydrolase
VNLGNATGDPSIVTSTSFTNRTPAQIQPGPASAIPMRSMSIHWGRLLDEKAALHIAKVGAALTKLTPNQANTLVPPASVGCSSTTSTTTESDNDADSLSSKEKVRVLWSF